MDTPPVSGVVENAPATSLGARMTNVFVTPSQVFDEVKLSPSAHRNWLVPTLILCLLGIISVWVSFSDGAVYQDFREQQRPAIEKKLAKIPEAQRAQAQNMIEVFYGPTAVKVFGSGAVLVFSFVQLFVYALLVWLFAKIAFKADFGYVKALETCGLASTILVLKTVVTTLLILITGHIYAKLSPVLLLSQFEATNSLHLLLASLDVITLWYLGVLAMGLGRLSGRSSVTSAAFVYGAWGLYTLGAISLAWLAQRG